MDELLIPFVRLINDPRSEYRYSERMNFPSNYNNEEKTQYEYIRTLAFYHDKIINEAFYNPDQEEVITETLESIKRFIEEKEFNLAQLHLVSLQLLLSMNIHLNETICYMVEESSDISKFVDKDRFLGKTNSYENGKKR